MIGARGGGRRVSAGGDRKAGVRLIGERPAAQGAGVGGSGAVRTPGPPGARASVSWGRRSESRGASSPSDDEGGPALDVAGAPPSPRRRRSSLGRASGASPSDEEGGGGSPAFSAGRGQPLQPSPPSAAPEGPRAPRGSTEMPRPSTSSNPRLSLPARQSAGESPGPVGAGAQQTLPVQLSMMRARGSGLAAASSALSSPMSRASTDGSPGGAGGPWSRWMGAADGASGHIRRSSGTATLARSSTGGRVLEPLVLPQAGAGGGSAESSPVALPGARGFDGSSRGHLPPISQSLASGAPHHGEQQAERQSVYVNAIQSVRRLPACCTFERVLARPRGNGACDCCSHVRRRWVLGQSTSAGPAAWTSPGG